MLNMHKINKNKRIELLAPAGSQEALEAVIRAGADAVYLSSKRYAMRQHGDWLNFKDEDLAKAIEYAHQHNVKAYITLNSLLTSLEIASLKEYLLYLEELKPDALIIHDLGLLYLMNEMNVKIPKHASTMMNVHHSQAAHLLKEKGISRIITSRDITVFEVSNISKNAHIEVEYFVHGDMCISQSAQCFHSGIATEMSSNRGKCLKSCRWKWNLIDRENSQVLAQVEEKYVLARKDICLFHQIPDLITAGIASLKIEGRSKKADYLEPIVGLYRSAIDSYYKDPTQYRTNFKDMNLLKNHTQREVHPNHAFSRPGVDSVGLTGKKEPRFFSLAVDESPYKPTALEKLNTSRPIHPAPKLAVRCPNVKTALEILTSDCDWIYVGGEIFTGKHFTPSSSKDYLKLVEQCHLAGKKIGIQTPRITTDRELFEIKELVHVLSDSPPDEYIVHNLGALRTLRNLTDVSLHADFSFNIWNPEATQLLKKEGVELFTPGVELNLEQISTLSQTAAMPMETMVHGVIPGMLLEYCVIGTHMTQTNKYDSCPGPCSNINYALKDQLNNSHWLEADQYCRNHLFMVKDLCTIDFLNALANKNTLRFRIEGVLYETDYLKKLIQAYSTAMNNMFKKDKNTISEEVKQEIISKAPRPLSAGAYTNKNEDISEPLTKLPTNLVISYDENGNKITQDSLKVK